MPERILAYTDKLSVEPGELVEVKVSSPRAGNYRAALVRVICGDNSPDGPGYKVEPVAGVPATEHAGAQAADPLRLLCRDRRPQRLRAAELLDPDRHLADLARQGQRAVHHRQLGCGDQDRLRALS